MDSFLISIIMNAHNAEKYLEHSIKSALNQTYQNFEIIFFNNNSIDNTKKIIKKFKDNRIKYFEVNKYLKLGEARNEAIKKSSGDFIAFLDCDDIWFPKKLEYQIPKFENQEVGIVISNSIFFYPDGKNIINYKKNQNYKFNFSNLLKSYNISLETVVIRKKVLDDLSQIFDNRFELIEELDLILRISYYYKIEYVDLVLAKWRIHENSSTWKNFGLFFYEKKILLNKLYRVIPNFSNLYQEEIYYFERSYNFEESLYLLLKNKNRDARIKIKPYKNDGLKWFLYYLCCFFNKNIFIKIQKLRGKPIIDKV